ncbi:tumor necrosis factor ligand superfamily member 9-like [Psammomys obesus]|uniref:tumor necrosis factor ligand superfamily member 9-like n=1 Tax=Psammomys obesus TaxID=48139 RepID=UPI0024532E33|nr:tumor necrosis factor ligand superfamily member 9-like [Psammomys obesus]
MDQHTLDVEDPTAAGHPGGTARLTDTVSSPDAATLKAPVRPTDAALPTLPTDAVHPSVRDPEAAWPSAPHGCSRRLLLACPGALVLSALVFGALCGPLALFTRTQTLPALTITTSPSPGRETAVSNPGSEHHTTGQAPVFAKLLAKDEALLSNRTLKWHSQDGADSVYLPSQDLSYEEDERELVVVHPGLYCVSLQLKLTPVSKNTGHKVQGWVSLVLQTKPQVDDLDGSALRVELSPHSMENSLVQGSWDRQVRLKAGHRLSVGLRAHLHGAQDAYKDWQLSQLNTTSFELFPCSPALRGNSYPHGCCRPSFS